MTEIIPITDNPDLHSNWLAAAESLHRQLRPDIPPPYIGYMQRMFSEGAEMAVLVEENQPRALAVFRKLHTTFHGLRFYVDDLVTDERLRGRSYGGQLLAWCEARARQNGCTTFDLDSGVQRALAHKFYFVRGLSVFAFSFTKLL